MSASNNLVENFTGNTWFIYVRDMETNVTTVVSKAPDGSAPNGQSRYPSISADGRYVAYTSDASNIVANDTNSRTDVFVYDRTLNQTRRVSEGSDGIQSNNTSSSPSISTDGRYVAFHSTSARFTTAIIGPNKIWVKDLTTNLLTQVSLSPGGTQVSGESQNPSISGDGRYVTFQSSSTNLVHEDTNDATNIFLRDMLLGTTIRISSAIDGT